MDPLTPFFKKARTLGVSITPEEKHCFEAYASLLGTYGDQLDLLSPKDLEMGLSKHFLDALFLLPHIGEEGKLVDLGSGAGLPGIPLKIIRPRLQVHLVEARRKKALFLKKVVRELSLENVSVYPKRWEEVHLAADWGVAKATGNLESLLSERSHLLRPGGRLFVYQSHRGETFSPKEILMFKNPLRGVPSYLHVYEG